jgi:hypothetical protein
LRRLYPDKRRRSELPALLNRTPTAIYKAASDLGLCRQRGDLGEDEIAALAEKIGRKPTARRMSSVVALRDKRNVPFKTIARILGVSPVWAWKIYQQGKESR